MDSQQERVRVLHCPIGNMNLGGIENMIMQLYRHIDRNKVQFDFIIHDSPENHFEKEILELGGRVFRVPFISKRPLRHMAEFKRLLEAHPEWKIVHIHTTYAIMYFDALAAKQADRTVILHSHNSSATMAHTAAHILLKKRMSKLADYRLACSAIAGDWLFDKRDSYEVWKNAVDLGKFRFDPDVRRRMRNELGLSGDDLLLGNVARLSYQKNQDFLISVFADFFKERPSGKLILVGDGEDRRMLEDKVKRLGLQDKVIFTGSVSNVSDYLMAIDVFCLTSRWEGSPVSLIEALASGNAAVIGSNSFNPLEYGDSALTVVRDASDKSEWIRKLLAVKPLSAAERARRIDKMQAAGYDIREQAVRVEKFYLGIS